MEGETWDDGDLRIFVATASKLIAWQYTYGGALPMFVIPVQPMIKRIKGSETAQQTGDPA